MRVTDVLSLPVVAMWQQKSRTVLTTLGVVFGAFVLAASLSIHEGVQETIERESHRSDVLRRIDVHPAWNGRASSAAADEVLVEGNMSEAKRERIRRALAAQEASSRQAESATLLTPETLAKLAALDHVERVEPNVSQQGFALLDGRSLPASIEPAHEPEIKYRDRLVAGRLFQRPDERTVVVNEFLLYQWGIADDEAIENILGRRIRIEIRTFRREPGMFVYLLKADGGEMSPEEAKAVAKITVRLPALLDQLDLAPEELELLRAGVSRRPAIEEPEVHALELSVVGVVRLPTDDERKERRWWESPGEAGVVLPSRTAADFFFRPPAQRERGVYAAALYVDREEHVKEVFRRATDLGLEGTTALEVIERERLMWLLVFGGMTCVAAVALMVAAMGIANTMLMSVLERTREIGVMKAVGAAPSHLLMLFLVEGWLIGLAGGGLGLLLAWAASFPGDAWVRSMVSRDMKIELREAIFVFPPWLMLSVVIFTVLVTTLAAVYPARRAAKIDPVAALRHE